MIRPFDIEDIDALYDMLEVEGLKKEDMGFLEHKTFVYDDGEMKGFYTYRIDYAIFPYLIHFCVRRDSRRTDVARALIRHFRHKMKDSGYRKIILHSMPLTEKIIKWYFKQEEPYGNTDNKDFYLVEA